MRRPVRDAAHGTAQPLATHGINAGVDGAFLGQRLHDGASFTGAFARIDTKELVGSAPQVFGNARVAYDLGGKLPTAALATTFTNAVTPFAVGPTLRAMTGYEKVSLAPTERWNAILGLQYDFGE